MPPKRRRRFQGLYYHSSPPKVMPMNGQPSNQGRKRREIDDFAVKLSTIRIWMHEKDIGKLTRILWAGQGHRLCQQASNNQRVKRFLAAVPHVMNSIKEVHQAVIDNNLETLQAKLEPPVPPALITCKDVNGLNLIHKAAGLGHTKILEYLIGVWPDGAHETDITGKTPLHWAASAKNNMRCYTLLTQAGCDEEAMDYKMKTPSYYRHKSHDIERAFLVYVPEAPRVSPDATIDWEALSEDSGEGKKLDIKIPETNGINGRAHTDDSIENTSEVDMNDGVSAVEEDTLRESAATTNGNESTPATPAHDGNEPAEAGAEVQPDHNGNANEIDADDEETNTKTLNETATTTPIETDEKDNASDNASAKDDEDDDEERASGTKASGEEDDEEEVNGNEIENRNAEEAPEPGAAAEAGKEDDAVEQEEGRESAEEADKDVVEGGEERDDDEVEKVESSENEAEADAGEEKEGQNGQPETQAEEAKCEVEENNEEKEKDDEAEKENNDKDVVEMKDEIEENDRDAEDEEKESDNDNDEAEKEDNSAESKEDENVKAGTVQSLNGIEDENAMQSQEEKPETDIEAEVENGADTQNETDKTEANVNNDDDSNDQNDAKSSGDEADEPEVDEQRKSAKTGNGTRVPSTRLTKVVKQDQETGEQMIADGSGDGIGKKPGSGVRSAGTRTAAAPISADHDDDDDDETNDSAADDEPAATETKPEPEPAAEDDTGEMAETDTLDENHNGGGQYEGAGSSPTSSLAIEGFVAGASEDNRVQSQSTACVDEDARIQDILAAGDMEQLAQIVLNGDGNKLLNMQSTEPEIQAFLNNVPNYMSKIRHVHEAARSGSLLSLQQALDRRKFAIAKDEISPNGATPLHVAVVFGNSDIVRYLAARFPETTTVTDNDGRTALHYAATIKDNGHFYNVLTQLGANIKTVDKLGHTPEFYQNSDDSKDILSYQKLLSDFGAEDLEDELLNDQGQAESHSCQSNPIFKTEQGKYLANNLAEPLIKALTEIANKRPDDPVAFLTGYLQSYLRARNPNGAASTAEMNGKASFKRSNNAMMSNGDVDRIEEDRLSIADEEESMANLDDRDEHGQSMLHFACARSHRRGALMHLIEESHIDITYRDELYRTARDVSLQANQPGNAKDIDRYVLSLAVVGDLRMFDQLAISGYDHIVDVADDNGTKISDIAVERGHTELVEFLENLRTLEEQREELHQMIRFNNVPQIKELVAQPNGGWLIKAKNYYGRTALHIAILKESIELVEHFVNLFPEALKIGDNLERTSLHYAMGTNSIESLSRILIQKGAKRTIKDLKGRQPTYYFMNKADILRLQEEEDENR